MSQRWRRTDLPKKKMARTPGLRYCRLMTAEDVKALPVNRKIQIMEAIWEDFRSRFDRIEISSLKRLHREEVIALAGLKPGDDMLAMKPRQIGEHLMKNPWVEKVKVRRFLPHTLAIEITEREPVAVVNMGYLYYLDKKGEVFKPLTDGDRLDYPALTGISEEDMWKDPAGSRAALKDALDLISLLSGGQVLTLADISEIHYDKGYGFTLFTIRGGVPVKLGNSGYSEKLARLGRIYRELQAQMPTLEYIDLDYSDKIIVKKV